MRGVGYLVGAAKRLYYLVHSHRRDDREPGNTRESRSRLGGNTGREMVIQTESGVWEVPLPHLPKTHSIKLWVSFFLIHKNHLPINRLHIPTIVRDRWYRTS